MPRFLTRLVTTPLVGVLFVGSAFAQSRTVTVDNTGTLKYPSASTFAAQNNLYGQKDNLAAVAAPTVTDDSASGYTPGSRWVDLVNDKVYTMVDDTVGAAVWADSTPAAGVTDHGSLTGLADDDHTQYLLADGTRSLAGDWSLGANHLTLASGSGYISYNGAISSSLGFPGGILTLQHAAGSGNFNVNSSLTLWGGQDGTSHTYLTAGDTASAASDVIITADDQIILTPGNGTGTDTVTVNGDIAVTGTVDGRDLATDGTKLDGIEASADVTDAANVSAAGALMDSEFSGSTAGHMIRTGAAAYSVLKHNLSASVAPAATDDAPDGGYAVGSMWVDTTGGKLYFCLDATNDAAVWQEVGAGGGGGGVADPQWTAQDLSSVLLNETRWKVYQLDSPSNFRETGEGLWSSSTTQQSDQASATLKTPEDATAINTTDYSFSWRFFVSSTVTTDCKYDITIYGADIAGGSSDDVVYSATGLTHTSAYSPLTVKVIATDTTLYDYYIFVITFYTANNHAVYFINGEVNYD